jgi:hypothetical protein
MKNYKMLLKGFKEGIRILCDQGLKDVRLELYAFNTILQYNCNAIQYNIEILAVVLEVNN